MHFSWELLYFIYHNIICNQIMTYYKGKYSNKPQISQLQPGMLIRTHKVKPKVIFIIIIIINNQDNVRGAVIIARVHPMNAEQCQMAANFWTKPTDLSRRPTCWLLGKHIHHCHFLLLSLKADTHFTIPQRVEG